MPKPIQNEATHLLAKMVKVPAKLRGECRSCGIEYETTGKEVAEGRRKEIFNGKFFREEDFLAFMIPCDSCGRPVQYVTQFSV